MWDGEIAGHIIQRLVETHNRTLIHFVVLAVATVHSDDGDFITVGVGVCGGAECFSPVGGELLDMLRMEAGTEGMAYVLPNAEQERLLASETVDDFICHGPGFVREAFF